MIRQASAVPEADVETKPVARVAPSPFRTYLWSVQRELWENHSIFIAPLVTAGLLLVGFVVAAARLPQHRVTTLALAPAVQRVRIEQPYDFAVSMILLIGGLVWLFYCLDALYGERRDRSILFWKSLPVSDTTTVLAKATIPLAVLPAVLFVATVATHLGMLLISTVVLETHGLAPTTTDQLPLLRLWGAAAYGMVVLSLWNAPIYAWLLMVSAWSRRATLLWALVPPLSLVILEYLAFQTRHVLQFFQWRGVGWTTEAFASKPRGSLMVDPMNPIAPLKYLSSPGLWLGLLVAAAFLVAAIRLRRQRPPL